jgi:hypothetical protein
MLEILNLFYTCPEIGPSHPGYTDQHYFSLDFILAFPFHDAHGTVIFSLINHLISYFSMAKARVAIVPYYF